MKDSKYDTFLEEHVKNMLGVNKIDQVDPELREFLNHIDEYCNKIGGSIRSRQIAALALAVYDLIYKLEGEDNESD